MAQSIIMNMVSSLLKIPRRLEAVVTAYLLSLMVESPKHTQSFAANISGISQSQFSKLLSSHKNLAEESLTSLAKTSAREAAKNRELLVAGTSWTVAVIIDATLHPRSSRHLSNAQRFNHGQGFVIGHQWTNIVLYVNGKTIPLPPIPYLTKTECQRRGIAYNTEHEHIERYLKDLSLAAFIGSYTDNEIVVLTDSGYDNKALEKSTLNRGWDFITALKVSRSSLSEHHEPNYKAGWQRIDKLFLATRKQAPWKTVRIDADQGKKRRRFRARKLSGYIRGVSSKLALVCSEKSTGKGRRYFACSNDSLSQGAILRGYAIRWRVELFHRACKSQLGLLDAGVEDFDSLVSHVHWAYCAYLLLDQLKIEGAFTMLDKQRRLAKLVAKAPWAKALKGIASSKNKFGGEQRRERLIYAALQDAMAA